MDDDELLHEGPDSDEQFVNTWQVMSESIGKVRFDAGIPGQNVGRSESMYAWLVNVQVVILGKGTVWLASPFASHRRGSRCR